MNLKDELKQLYLKLKHEMKHKWNRELPFDEMVFDRWEKASELGFGKGASIYHNSYVYGDVKVGSNTWIGPFTILDGSGGLTIGNYCSISAGVQIYSHNSVRWAVSGGKEEYEKGSVKIGDSCFIGPNTVIKNGVTIGNNSIIGVGSFVNKDIPPFSIAFGTPAVVKGKVKIINDKVFVNYF